MHPPLRLDLGRRDLCAAAVHTVVAREATRRREAVEAHFGPRSLACLSVRSAFDLFLAALALPAGSEVLLSGFTVPDMARIVEAHGLVVVPIDLELDTLALSIEQLEAARTDRTRLVVLAHLFGSRIDLDPVVAFCRAHELLLVEDGAQVFGLAPERHGRGHPEADASLFSFGTIKTRTALGGGLVRVRDAELLERMRALQDAWPLWPRRAFAGRVAKAALLKTLSWPPLYGACVAAVRLAGGDHEQTLHRSARGFRGDLRTTIRHRPNAPLLALLERRLREDPAERTRVIERRTRCAEELLARLPAGVTALGSRAPDHTHWVLAVLCDEPDRLVTHLRRHGFDATRAATVTAITRDGHALPNGERLRDGVVYVPAGAWLSERARMRLGDALERFA